MIGAASAQQLSKSSCLASVLSHLSSERGDFRKTEFPSGASLRGDAADDGESRAQLLDLPAALVEDMSRDRHEKTAEDFCDVFQVCFPYRGLGVWHVGSDDVVADANRILFITAGESFRMSGPVGGGYAELIVTPDVALLAEIAGAGRAGLRGHPRFRFRSGLAMPPVQSLRARFLHWARTATDPEDLEAEEFVIALLRATFDCALRATPRCSAATARLIRRTKELLESDLSKRLRLTEISRTVGASPAYLTDTFRRVEGLTLHRYLLRLRLARALVELPYTDDLTALALDLGFSSHSHFSAAFRRTFGCAPSTFRESTRGAREGITFAQVAGTE